MDFGCREASSVDGLESISRDVAMVRGRGEGEDAEFVRVEGAIVEGEDAEFVRVGGAVVEGEDAGFVRVGGAVVEGEDAGFVRVEGAVVEGPPCISHARSNAERSG